jgi:hypothetical protein
VNPFDNSDFGIPSRKDVETARFIVNSCNNHDALVEILRMCVEEMKILSKFSIQTQDGSFTDVDQVYS